MDNAVFVLAILLGAIIVYLMFFRRHKRRLYYPMRNYYSEFPQCVNEDFCGSTELTAGVSPTMLKLYNKYNLNAYPVQENLEQRAPRDFTYSDVDDMPEDAGDVSLGFNPMPRKSKYASVANFNSLGQAVSVQ